jgi:lipopolysaccharide transport protein LptA
MNPSHHLPLLGLLLTMAWLTPSPAQDMDATGADTAPAGSTVITADELRSDEATRTSIFTGNVVVTGTNFNMTCQEMTVIFTKDNKVDNILAIGNVIITQPDRITHSGQAQYFSDEDKFVLTDQPVINDHKNEVSATKITIYRANQKMITEGRSKVVIINGGPGSGTPTPTP